MKIPRQKFEIQSAVLRSNTHINKPFHSQRNIVSNQSVRHLNQKTNSLALYDKENREVPFAWANQSTDGNSMDYGNFKKRKGSMNRLLLPIHQTMGDVTPSIITGSPRVLGAHEGS